MTWMTLEDWGSRVAKAKRKSGLHTRWKRKQETRQAMRKFFRT